MNQPLVTIGATNYNSAKYVLDTLQSIKAQTYTNIELIIVDDCSTDDGVQIIKEWLKDYNKPNVFIIHENNKGACAACNTLIKNANGKYIYLIATDDIMMPDAISNQVEIMEKAGADVGVVYSDAYLMKEDGSPRFGLYIQRFRDFEDAPSGDVFDELLKGNFIPGFSMLVKNSCYKDVGGFDEELQYEDYDMLLRLSRKYKFIFSEYISFKYRVRKNSLSTIIRNWNASKLKIFAKHSDYSSNVIAAMEMSVRNAYYERDKEALNDLFKYKHLSKYIARLNILWKLRVPQSVVRSLSKMNNNISRKIK